MNDEPIEVFGYLWKSLYHTVKYAKVFVPYKGKRIAYCVKKYVSVPSEGHFIILYNFTFKQYWSILEHVSPFVFVPRR